MIANLQDIAYPMGCILTAMVAIFLLCGLAEYLKDGRQS